MRTARILSVALHNPTDSDDPDAERRTETGLSNVLSTLDLAANYDPDFVCFPEVALQHAARQDGLLEEAAQPIPGPATEAVGEKARELDSYVWLPMYERDGDAFHNSVALVDPEGEVRGVFRKLAPTIGEIESGIVPGTEIPVWETEFGRVGALICWDSRYSEVGAELGAKGANLVFFPTHGSADERLRTWAQYNGYHVALCDKHEAKVYTPRRNVVGEMARSWHNPEVEDVDLHGGSACLSFAEVNVDTKAYARGSASEWPNAVRERYGGSVVVDAMNDDGVFVVESVDEALTLDDLEREFGMETARAYEERTRAAVHDAVDDSPLRGGSAD